MLTDEVSKAIIEIAKDILALWQKVLATDIGINKKTRINTLSDSNLSKDIYIDSNLSTILFNYNDYAEYIESGRKPHARKVPIDALREWAKEKGISTDNNVLYAIREAIYRDGISPRPIFSVFEEMLDKNWDETYAEYLFITITEHLEKYFKQ